MFKAPIRGIRSPIQLKKEAPSSVLNIEHLIQVFSDLQQLKQRLLEVESVAQSHVESLQQELERIQSIQKGDKGEQGEPGDFVAGDPGEKGDPPSKQELLSLIKPLIPSPVPGPKGDEGKPGKNPDPTEVMRLVLTKLPLFKGTPETPEIDVAEIISAITKKKLSISSIEGLRELLSSLQGRVSGAYLHGGGDTVKAGTNITLTRNADGTTTITAAGGGGFSTLTATETPNGSRTAFTFAAAVAQPTYLVVDNVWMKAVSKAGTVNWTWAGTTATLSVPAQDDIFGVV
jgi:hypothetical protein